MTEKTLFEPCDMGGLTLANRVVMAPFLANDDYDLDLATARLNEDQADLFAFGRPFISNPDLVERLRSSAPRTPLDPATLYGGGAAGYIDYPTLSS